MELPAPLVLDLHKWRSDVLSCDDILNDENGGHRTMEVLVSSMILFVFFFLLDKYINLPHFSGGIKLCALSTTVIVGKGAESADDLR